MSQLPASPRTASPWDSPTRGLASAARRAIYWVSALGLSLSSTVSLAQVQVDWVTPERGVSVAVDSADHSYVLDYEYSLGAEMSLSKLDPDGQVLWQASHDQSDSTKWERASWVTVDHAGDVVVCGTLMSGYSNPVEAASIAMKFDAGGVLIWRHVYESGFDGSSTKRVLVDGTNHVYVLGLGAGPAGFVTKIRKFAPDGTPLWSWFDAAGIGAPLNFKLTADGALLVIGRGITGSINGYAKVTLDGATIWGLPGVNSLTIGDAAGDAAGNTYVVHGQYPSGGGTVVRKLDPAGTLLWQEVFPLTAYRVEVGGDQRAIVCGFPSPSTGGAAFAKVDTDGGLVWSNLDADGPLGLLLHAQLLVDGGGNAYLAAGTLFDMAVCKVNADGTSGWTATVPGGYSQAIALGAGGASVFVVGGNTARLLQPIGATFSRGDCNDDATLNLADAVFLLERLFIGGAIPCADACDVNDDSGLDISDPVAVLGALFGGSFTIPAPSGACGVDPTADPLSCDVVAGCP